MFMSGRRGNAFYGSSVMPKFESFAFVIGLVLTGLLSLAAAPLA